MIRVVALLLFAAQAPPTPWQLAADRCVWTRANQFVDRWNQWGDLYTAGVVDIKAARRVSKAFRRIEGCPAWPK